MMGIGACASAAITAGQRAAFSGVVFMWGAAHAVGGRQHGPGHGRRVGNRYCDFFGDSVKIVKNVATDDGSEIGIAIVFGVIVKTGDRVYSLSLSILCHWSLDALFI